MCALDLVIVVVQAGDVCAGELGDLSCWSTNTATNIENLHSVLDADLVGEVVLMASDSLEEWLVGGEAAEVEGLAPTVLVKVGTQVVVMLGKSGVLSLSCLIRELVSCFDK